MEKERAYESVGIFAHERFDSRGISPIFITASVAVLALLIVIGLELTSSLKAQNAQPTVASAQAQGSDSPAQSTSTPLLPLLASTSASSSDPISQLGPTVVSMLSNDYTQLQQAGIFSTTTALAAGASLAPLMNASVSYPTFSASDIATDPDTSYARMMQYRADLQTSLAPLLKNKEPEYEIFAYYVQTGDTSYLAKLQQVADDYRAAASSTAKVVVPADAVSYHVAILNAMEEFAATLDAMVAHASDPYASVALLNTYNRAENDMITSFNALTTYYRSKTPPQQ